jgi:phosphoribosylanthranilate isomerase
MLEPKVKICGITNLDDAVKATELGADLLGFNFYPQSPRYIEPQEAEKIIAKLPASIDTAGLFVNADADTIRKIAGDLMLDWVQLHGDENPQFCALLDNMSAQIIKAIRVKDAKDIDYVKNFSTDALLLDAYNPSLYGGTGQRFDWSTLPELTGYLLGKTFLAGGINPENVAEALGQGFYGIDVCSGIEDSPRKKNHKKMEELFKNIRIVTTGVK